MQRDNPLSTTLGQELVRLAQDINKRIDKLMKKYVPPFKPAIVEIDIDRVAKMLEKLPNFSFDKWMPLDGRYYTTTLEMYREMARWDITNYMPYVVDRFDCDKYAMLFKARMAQFFGVNAVALVLDYDAGHSYNIVLPSDTDPVIYEPQADRFIDIASRDKRFYRLGEHYYIVL